jgi:nucleoside-diphosphate-sugar epimerase
MKINANGEVFNIGGGSRISVNEVVEKLERVTGKKAEIKYIGKQKGDVKHTYADISKAKRMLGYKPKIKIEKGLTREVEWIKNEIM